MNNINEVQDLMQKLVVEVELDGEKAVFSEKAKSIIKEISEYARTTNFYKKNKERINEFWNESERDAGKVYHTLLYKIVEAPTSLHRDGCIIAYLPVLDEILNEKGEK